MIFQSVYIDLARFFFFFDFPFALAGEEKRAFLERGGGVCGLRSAVWGLGIYHFSK